MIKEFAPGINDQVGGSVKTLYSAPGGQMVWSKLRANSPETTDLHHDHRERRRRGRGGPVGRRGGRGGGPPGPVGPDRAPGGRRGGPAPPGPSRTASTPRPPAR